MPFGQILCELIQQILAILRAFLPALLELDNATADFPIGGRHEAVRCADDGAAGLLQQRTDAGKQGGISDWTGFGGWLPVHDGRIVPPHRRRKQGDCR